MDFPFDGGWETTLGEINHHSLSHANVCQGYVVLLTLESNHSEEKV